MNKTILTMEEFGQLPTEEKKRYLSEQVHLAEGAECPFWIERLYYAVKMMQPNRLTFLDPRLGKWYQELV